MSIKIFAKKVCDCGKNYQTAVMSGLPVNVCLDDVHGDCAQVDSNIITAKLLALFPFDGMIMPYKGFVNGLKAWWCWFWHHGSWFDTDGYDDFE